jgi:MYXO-CTERM domain-containing protein
MRLPIAACALAAALASPASADILPRDYVETCTLERQQRPGETCVACAGHFYDHDACSRTYEKDGFAQRCRGGGASHWGEVWCKGGKTGAAQLAGNSGSAHAKGCDVGSSQPASTGLALLLVAVASLALLRAQRRRR